MGAESSALHSLQEPAWTLPSGLTVHPAQLRDGRLCSVFIYKPENEDKVNKAAQHLKTLRHPCLLRFLSCTVDLDGIHLVTERVRPLEMVLDSLSSDEICAGIYDVLQALVFLHDTGNSAHNNVCLSSIFVSEDGHWKLGGMEMVSKLTEAAPEFAEFGIMLQAHGYARDAYSFGKMVENLLTYVTDKASADLVSRFMCTLNSTILNADPACRPPLSTLLKNEFFRNDFLEVVSFLKHLTVKTEDEKNEFFKFLLDRVSGLPEELIVSRLVPLLLHQLVFAEPVAIKSFLPHLLRPKKDAGGRRHSDRLLSPELYKARVIPQLLKLFTVHEEHVRMVLLTHIDAYGELFSKEELKNEILPQVLLGLRDINNSMVAMTLHSLAVLVSLLGPEVVIGGDRTKIFKCTAPSFTKTADTTPEDSPVHMNHIMLINQPVKHSFVNVLSKTPLSEDELVIIKASEEEEETLTSLSEAETDVQPVLRLTMNAVSSDPELLVSGSNLLGNSVLPAEEWPDWSESEDLRNESSIRIQILADENDVRVGLQPKNNNTPIEPCDDSSSKDLTLTFHTGGVKDPLSVTSLFVECPESMHTRSSTANCEVNFRNNSQDYQNEDQHSNRNDLKTSKMQHEKNVEKKYPNEFGLGEEFTIQVKRKSHDPELDLFADMVPEIKSLTSSLILPTILDSEKAISSKVNPKEEVNVPFSSKFAATDITETGAEGWGVADLNWDDDENLW